MLLQAINESWAKVNASQYQAGVSPFPEEKVQQEGTDNHNVAVHDVYIIHSDWGSARGYHLAWRCVASFA